ncbi:hypothetical protein [Rhizobium sp.]
MAEAKDEFFSPTKMNAFQKAENTHQVAMEIIDAEVVAREKKTERLRQLRLEREAAAPAAEPPKRGKRKV